MNFDYLLQTIVNKYNRLDSFGESKIKKILDELKVSYEQEMIFPVYFWGNTHYIRADFYLPKYKCVIEYNGEQHYKPELHKSENHFKYQQERDKQLEIYCLNNNIKYIVYTYEDYLNGNLKRDLEKLCKLKGKVGTITLPEIL